MSAGRCVRVSLLDRCSATFMMVHGPIARPSTSDRWIHSLGDRLALIFG